MMTQVWSRPPITKAIRPLVVKLATRAQMIEANQRMPAVLSVATSVTEENHIRDGLLRGEDDFSVGRIALSGNAAAKSCSSLSPTLDPGGGDDRPLSPPCVV